MNYQEKKKKERIEDKNKINNKKNKKRSQKENHNKSMEYYNCNVFDELKIKNNFMNKKIKGKNYKIQLLDTAGQERFKSIMDGFYHLGKGFFAVFDLTDENSLKSVHNWVKEIQEKSQDPDPVIIILGNKNDLENIRISKDIIKKELENYKDKIYIETSAKANTNITYAFEQIIDLIEKDNNLKSDINSFAITKKNHKNKKNIQCC